jgi:uncharacterized protein (TIGR02284 family)
MENTFDNVIKVLNRLIETNLDRIKGYETAAEDAKDADVKALCNEYAGQSRTFKSELERLVTEHGGEPQKSSSASGAVYRAWMNVKSTLSGHDKKAIYSECEFGEDAAKNSYAEARKDASGFPDNVLSAISRQHTEILKAHDRVKQLRDQLVEHH